MTKSIVVLDPGHGGVEDVGGSSSNRATGPNGLLEKDVVFDIAGRVKSALEPLADVRLTRTATLNVSLSDRARAARDSHANVFVSLHMNGSSSPEQDNSEAWIARGAGARSRELAQSLVERIARAAGIPSRGVQQRDLGVLLASRHQPETAACLLEMAFLSNPEEARKLNDPAYRQRLAEALTDGIRTFVSTPATQQAYSLEKHHRNSPEAWAEDHVAEGLQRFGDFGNEFRRQCGIVFPGVPPELLMGFALNGGVSENTTGFITGLEDERPPRRERPPLGGVARQAFHELGMFGVEGGPRSGPAPAADSSWSRLARSADVSRLLGRAGNVQPGGWYVPPRPKGGWPTMPEAIRDQIAIGLVNVREHGQAVVHDLPAGLRPSSENSLWFLALCFTGWSAGNGRAVQHLNQFAGDLAAVAETQRWGRFLRLLMEAGRTGHIRAQAGHRAHHRSPYWSALRTLQKIEAGLLLARRLNGNVAFFDDGLDAERASIHEAISHFAVHGVPAEEPGVAPQSIVESELQVAGEVYRGTRTHTPANNAASFRCAPVPAAVTSASFMPVRSTNADADTRTALGQAGLSPAQVTQFEHDGGLPPLRPFAELFGAAALTELLQRLRYTPAMLIDPPHGHGRNVNRVLGVHHTAEILAPRLLLAIPGHFRELARRTTDPREAHALENLGWLLMRSVKDSVRAATGKNWWVPPAPVFVTPFANPIPALTQQLQRCITALMLIDTTMTYADYNVRFGAWNTGLAGRQWRLETGVDPSPAGAGQPFYPQMITIPAAVNIAAQKAQIDGVWHQRVQDTDALFPPNSPQSRAELTKCKPALLQPLHLIQTASLGGIEMEELSPIFEPPASAPHRGLVTSLPVLAAIQPVFEQVFHTMYELGWNDLVFQTEGAGCFRGTKIDTNPGAARTISNHGYGIAIDILDLENPQGPARSTQDPRVVALFEAFHFRWGRCFPRPDAMHFEYCGAAC